MCFIGDTGKDTSAQAVVAEALESEKCNSVYFLGDIIYKRGIWGASDPEFKKKFLDYYQRIPEKDHKPKLHLIMGNHDHRGSVKAWFELSKKFPFIYYPHYYYFQNTSGYCVFALDSEFYLQPDLFPLVPQQEKWLKDTLAREKSCKVTMALTHHPYKSSGRAHGNATNSVKQFHETQVLGKFDLLLSGHDHILSFEGVSNGTSLFVSGTGGDPDKGQLPGFLTLEVEKLGESAPQIIFKSIMTDGQVRLKKFSFKPIDRN